MDKSLYYFDPNHGGCLRIVNKISKDSYIFNGAYGSDEEKKGYWAATAKKTKLFDYKDKKINYYRDLSIVSFKPDALKKYSAIISQHF